MISDSDRRYDIDWLRVVAIALLLIYHIAIMFQPWGVFIGFIQSAETSEAIWIPMALLNIWRIRNEKNIIISRLSRCIF